MRVFTILGVSAAAVGIAVLSSGCSEWDVKYTGDWVHIDCPTTTCSKSYTVDVEALVACYDYDLDQGGWGPDTPDEVRQQCTDPSLETCSIGVEPDFETPMVDGGCCVQAIGGWESELPQGSCEDNDGVEIPSCSVPTDLTWSNAWNDIGESLTSALRDDCGIDLAADPPGCDPNRDPVWGDVVPDMCVEPGLPDETR